MKFPPIYHYEGPEEDRGAWIREAQKVIRIADSTLYNENVKQKRYIKSYADGSFINIVNIGSQYMLNIVPQPKIPVRGGDEFVFKIDEVVPVIVLSRTRDTYGESVYGWIVCDRNFKPQIFIENKKGDDEFHARIQTEEVEELKRIGLKSIYPMWKNYYEPGDPTAFGKQTKWENYITEDLDSSSSNSGTGYTHLSTRSLFSTAGIHLNGNDVNISGSASGQIVSNYTDIFTMLNVEIVNNDTVTINNWNTGINWINYGYTADSIIPEHWWNSNDASLTGNESYSVSNTGISASGDANEVYIRCGSITKESKYIFIEEDFKYHSVSGSVDDTASGVITLPTGYPNTAEPAVSGLESRIIHDGRWAGKIFNPSPIQDYPTSVSYYVSINGTNHFLYEGGADNLANPKADSFYCDIYEPKNDPVYVYSFRKLDTGKLIYGMIHKGKHVQSQEFDIVVVMNGDYPVMGEPTTGDEPDWHHDIPGFTEKYGGFGWGNITMARIINKNINFTGTVEVIKGIL